MALPFTAAERNEMEAVYRSVVGHKEFVPFLSLGLASLESSSLSASAVHSRSVDELRAIVERALVLHDPPYCSRVPRAPFLPPRPRLMYHEIIYLERKISKLVFAQFDKRVECICGLWRWLQGIRPCHVLIRIDRQRIEDFVREDSPLLIRLKLAFHNRLSFVEKLLRPLSDSDSVNAAIAAYVRGLANGAPNDGYHRMMRLLTSDLFVFSQALAAAADKFFELEPRLFLGLLFDLISAMGRVLGLKSEEVRALNLIVYRFVFDATFAKNDVYKSQIDLLSLIVDIPVASLELPLEFCPPAINLNATLRDVFRSDPWFRQAVLQLECIPFYTNPLDILTCAADAIRYIKVAATHYSGGAVLFFSFEVAFGLFLAVLLSCEIPELDAVATFVQNYTPKSRLDAVMEYGKSNLVAGAMYCRNSSHRGSRGETHRSVVFVANVEVKLSSKSRSRITWMEKYLTS
jgi:hypothetical protein